MEKCSCELRRNTETRLVEQGDFFITRKSCEARRLRESVSVESHRVEAKNAAATHTGEFAEIQFRKTDGGAAVTKPTWISLGNLAPKLADSERKSCPRNEFHLRMLVDICERT